MFKDDIDLVAAMVAKHGPAPAGPIVDIGGLTRPCVADYQGTIDAVARLRMEIECGLTTNIQDRAEAAQRCRYLDIMNPLSFLGDYACENPETGGLPIDRLHEKYPSTIALGTCLSVLEHVDQPWFAEEDLFKAFMPGGLLIISVPWTFPWHGNPVDHFRFSPTGLQKLFGDRDLWDELETGWRLDVPASAGVVDLKTGRPQAIQSAYWVGRAR